MPGLTKARKTLRFHRTEHKKIKLNEQKKKQTDKKQTYRTKEREKKYKSEAFIQQVWALFLRLGSKKARGHYKMLTGLKINARMAY